MPSDIETGLLSIEKEETMRKLDTKDDMLHTFSSWIKQSEDMRSSYEQRWTKNIRLLKGVWNAEEKSKSTVRGRSKLFFRKIWATSWRLLASFYQAFLKDDDVGSYDVEGRGSEDVKPKAKLLRFIMDYRIDKMNGEQGLFLQHIWGMQNIIHMGLGVGKMWWEYRNGKDRPCFKTYPNEQVYLDFSASTKDEMRYVMFRNFMTKVELEEQGYSNIDKAKFATIPFSSVRSARYAGGKDPIASGNENAYPSPDSANANKVETGREIYLVDEWFWKDKEGKIWAAVANDSTCYLKSPKISAYDCLPVVVGLCLTEANKLPGEGFPEPLEGPQESINHLINVRKDNIHLALNKHKYVNRYGNVDLASLVNSRSGGVTLMDDTTAVRTEETPDVTQGSYTEASKDEEMMMEMSGITDAKMGSMQNEKATTAQINLSEANAKIELFTSIVSKTWFHDFYRTLAKMIQKFETDETIFRVANEKMNRELEKQGKPKNALPIYIIDDFDADIRIKVGLSSVAKQSKIQNTLVTMDRAIMANQSMIALLKAGVIQPGQKVNIFDITKFMDDLLPELGKKDVQNYVLPLITQQPQQQGGQGTQNDAAMAGGQEVQMPGIGGGM